MLLFYRYHLKNSFIDGGSFRGYSLLLILRELMKAIEEIEREWHYDPVESSFHPLEPNTCLYFIIIIHI